MNVYSDCELLQTAINSLHAEDVREKYDLRHGQTFSNHSICRNARNVKSHVESAAQELSLESFANFETELYQVPLPIFKI